MGRTDLTTGTKHEIKKTVTILKLLSFFGLTKTTSCASGSEAIQQKILETDDSNVKPNSIKEVKVKSRDLLTKSDSLRKEMICTTSGNRRFRVFFQYAIYIM